MIKIEGNRNAAFTLMETLITVVILGLLAAILVPNLIKNQVENANRRKVKKAMAVYEKAINFMIVENDIKSTEALRELGQDNCQYTREYFKTVKDGSNNCIFKTADRVWWDITDITNPIISLKDEITDSNKAAIRANASSYNSDTTSFALVGRFDDMGTLRVNDNAYEQTYGTVTNQKYVAKLWFFITQSVSALSGLDRCKAEGAVTCTITANGVSMTYEKITTNTDINISYNCFYDRENKIRNCDGHTSVAPKGEYWITEDLGKLTKEEAIDMKGSVCVSSRCISDGDYYEAAKRKCAQSGGHLASLAELSIAKENGKFTDNNGSWYWASEEASSDAAPNTYSNGDVGGYSKYSPNGRVICVGD